VKYKALFFILIYFFPNSPTEVIRRRIFTHKGPNYAQLRKEVSLWLPHDGRPHLWDQIPPKLSKLAFYKHVRTSANALKTNDVIEDWLRLMLRQEKAAVSLTP